jgi:hypothetical protein
MGEIFDAVCQFLEQDKWPLLHVDAPLILRTQFDGQRGDFTCYAQAREEQEQFIFYSVFPLRVAGMDLARMAEYLTRANCGLPIGNFELDYTNGEVRFKTSIDLEDAAPDPRLLRNMLYANVLTMDKYAGGLLRVMYGGISPEEAIGEIEG